MFWLFVLAAGVNEVIGSYFDVRDSHRFSEVDRRPKVQSIFLALDPVKCLFDVEELLTVYFGHNARELKLEQTFQHTALLPVSRSLEPNNAVGRLTRQTSPLGEVRIITRHGFFGNFILQYESFTHKEIQALHEQSLLAGPQQVAWIFILDRLEG